MNGPPTGFAGWISRMQMASYTAFTGDIRSTIVVLVLIAIDARLLLAHATELLYSRTTEPMAASAAVSVFLAHNTAAEQMRQAGLYLAGIIAASVFGIRVANVFDQKHVRETSREAYEGLAQVEKAKAAATAAPDPVQELRQVPTGINLDALAFSAEAEEQWQPGSGRQHATEGLG